MARQWPERRRGPADCPEFQSADHYSGEPAIGIGLLARVDVQPGPCGCVLVLAHRVALASTKLLANWRTDYVLRCARGLGRREWRVGAGHQQRHVHHWGRKDLDRQPG